MPEPKAGRPWMPGYGVPDSLDGALHWSWAEERLVGCRYSFLATTRPDGRPHVMPLWGGMGEGRVMTPRVAFGLREDETFSTSATRWEF